MGLRRRLRAAGLAAALPLALTTACTGGGEDPPAAEPGAGVTSPGPTPPGPTAENSPAAEPTAGGSTGTTSGGRADDPPAGGPRADPARVRPVPGLLDWQPVPGPVSVSVTQNRTWTLTVDRDLRAATLDGPYPRSMPAGTGYRINDALLDDDYAVVVAQDALEERPSVATVVDLATGAGRVIDGAAEVPTTTGGSWALGAGSLLHATIDADGGYCLASHDLRSRTSRVAWCAPPRTGFSNLAVTPAGTTMLTFDAGRPQCRTLNRLEAGAPVPLAGPARCRGWEAVLLDTGPVWSVVPDENRFEAARFYAEADGGFFELGPGDSGSLVRCGDSAYFTRQPVRDGDPARLLRWHPGRRLEVAYESPGSPGFLEAPRCGGDRITVTALSAGGDEQVWAAVD